MSGIESYGSFEKHPKRPGDLTGVPWNCPRALLPTLDGKRLVTSSLKKMAADSESTRGTLHLSDIEKNPKEMNERGKEASKQQPTTSKTEIFCKTLAFLIVLCLVCVHLARVIREGKYCLAYADRNILIGMP